MDSGRGVRATALAKRTFSTAQLCGSLEAEQLGEHRHRVLQKASDLAFPDDAVAKYRLTSVRKRYGRDVSYGGNIGLSALHKHKLDALLNDLILRHQWTEVAGVLSVLLRSIFAEKDCVLQHVGYFWAAMEATKQMAGLDGNDSKFRRMYQTLYDKLANGKAAQSKVKAGAVRLEFALYLMSQKHYGDAQLASSPCMLIPSYRDHPVANLIHGLIHYYHWYELTRKEVEDMVDMREMGNVKSEEVNLSEGVGENEENLSSNFLQKRQNNHEGCHLESGDVFSQCNAPCHANSHSDSLKNGNKSIEEHDCRLNDSLSTFDVSSNPGSLFSFEKREEEFMFDVKEECEWYFHDEEDADDKLTYIRKARLIFCRGLDPRLFPFRLPRSYQDKVYILPMKTAGVGSSHSNAIIYLRNALKLDKHTMSALLPLAQLLLARTDVEGAYETIVECCEGSKHYVPFRILCALLESLTPKNREMLADAYEELLEIDPTCEHAIGGLIGMHRTGAYATESLLQQLSIHLDGCPGSLSVWKNLLLCFEKLISIKNEMDMKNGDVEQIIFQEDSYAAWSNRERWWPTKHFAIGNIQEEAIGRGIQWILYKAAAAGHIFGSSVNYVSRVHSYLQTSGGDNLVTKLQKYMESPFNLFSHLKRCKDLLNHRSEE